MSNKTNNKSIFLGLKIIAILVFAVAFLPAPVKAEVCITSIARPCYVPAPAPFINYLNPNPVNKSPKPFVLTVYGENFLPGAVVEFNGYNRTTNYLGYGGLAVQINSGDISTSGNYSIRVVNPDGQASNSVFLAVNKVLIDNNVTAGSTVTSGSNSGTKSASSTSSSSSIDGSNDESKNVNKDTSSDNLAANALLGSNGLVPSGLVQWILFLILVLLLVLIWRKLFIRDETPLKHA